MDQAQVLGALEPCVVALTADAGTDERWLQIDPPWLLRSLFRVPPLRIKYQVQSV
jgi:hypothetical protein